MIWETLSSTQQLDALKALSFSVPQIIFKHSTRCSVSSVVKQRLEKTLPAEQTLYYLDLLSYRTLSNTLAEIYGVKHESPQILIIKDGICIYHASHLAIQADDITSAVQ